MGLGRLRLDVHVGLAAALPLIAGTTVGICTELVAAVPLACLPVLWGAAGWTWRRTRSREAAAALAAGFFAAGAALGADARAEALQPTLRTALDERIGGFDIETAGPEADHDPLPVEVTLVEDAAPGDGFVSLRGRVARVTLGATSYPADGTAIFSVAGDAAPSLAHDWVAGRTLRMPATFRRPSRYLNAGVPDFERQLALDGVSLLGSVKSGLLVEVVSAGSRLDEWAAAVRAFVRGAVAERVAPHGGLSAAIVTAVLIGDRTGLPDDVRERLQAAGTYHVIAISGGNIAILAALTLAGLALAGVRGRAAAALTIAVLMAYAQVVAAGPSVWRATLMAVLYFSARALDHQSPPWHVASVAAAAMVAIHPLDVRNPGFILTFGATAALLEGARRAGAIDTGRWWLRPLVASVAASLATEIALLPVSAQAFSRVTVAGVVLNLLAVPLMTAAQIAGMAVVLLGRLDVPASWAGLAAHLAASGIVESARLVDAAPWLTTRVPPPGAALVVAYYASLLVWLWGRRRRLRAAAAVALGAAAVTIVAGATLPSTRAAAGARGVRLTLFDVGQGESLLLQLPDGGTMLVDTGGSPFGGGSFDIGARVLAPALWAQGVSRLRTMLVTHGDPDHLGGAPTLLDAFDPRELWEGIRVPSHAPGERLRARALAGGARGRFLRRGESMEGAGVRIRVLHPPEADWERPRVRNDDSVVLEVLYGDVAFLLTGDISEVVEREIVALLTPARLRVLKVGHHGSRTSTGRELLEAWRPQIALISSGRGNTFGHPAPEVLERLRSVGATVLRTDRDGQITVETDGHRVEVTTFVESAR